jgi:hypothetical protein
LTLFYRRDTRTVVKRTSNSAYPKVVSNLGALMDTSKGRVAINMIRFMNCYARSILERARIIAFFKEDRYVEPVVVEVRQGGGLDLEPLLGTAAFKEEVQGAGIGTKDMMGMMNDYFAVGYANTVGYAHPNTGDTMTSVMIGGLRTVMNGDFEIFPGDLVQFYWCVVVLSRFPCFFPSDFRGAGPLRRTTSCPAGAASRTSTSGTRTRRATWTPPPCQTAAPVGP